MRAWYWAFYKVTLEARAFFDQVEMSFLEYSVGAAQLALEARVKAI